MQFGETNRSIAANSEPSPQSVARGGITSEREAWNLGLVSRESRALKRTAHTARLKIETGIARPVWLKQVPLFRRPTNKSFNFNHEQLRNARNIFSQTSLSFDRNRWTHHRMMTIGLASEIRCQWQQCSTGA